jgi:dTDP-4-dehydrorhamnose reductase
MLLNQVRATILAMREIRTINPAAKLVQTEDLSKTHSTALLSYQASFDNNRRWLTWDLLCGKVTPSHVMWNYFISCGIPEEDLLFFVENSCAPDIMGFNYYVTSERYLDENIDSYPRETHGGNGRHRFVDTEAARSGHMQGIAPLLAEAWQRYQLPIAVTECHLCCTREEQLRWLNETWEACCRLKQAGTDIRAVTAWALLGAFDWNSLLVQHNLSYEAGVFDLRHGNPQPTLLAKMISSLSADGFFKHPLLNQRGWWAAGKTPTGNVGGRVVLIVGKNNPLSNEFAACFTYRSIPFHIAGSDATELTAFIMRYQPWAVINTLGATGIENTEDEDTYHRLSLLLAITCHAQDIRLMAFSGNCDAYKNKMLLTVVPAALLIQVPQPVYTALHLAKGLGAAANKMMDLFIDEEKGVWQLLTRGRLIKANSNIPAGETSNANRLLAMNAIT